MRVRFALSKPAQGSRSGSVRQWSEVNSNARMVSGLHSHGRDAYAALLHRVTVFPYGLLGRVLAYVFVQSLVYLVGHPPRRAGRGDDATRLAAEQVQMSEEDPWWTWTITGMHVGSGFAVDP